MSADGISISAVPDRLKQKAFWTRMLYGAAAPTDLHVNTSPERRAAVYCSRSWVGAYAAQIRLDALGMDGRGAYATCVASILILIHQYTAMTDVMVGLPPHDWRGETPLDSCLLPLRYSFKPKTTVGEARQAVANLILEMYRNQDARGEPLPAQTSPRPSAGDWPRLSIAVVPAAGSDAAPDPPDGGITIAVSTAANEFNLSSKFDVRHYDRAGVAQLLDDAARIAEVIVADPNKLASDGFVSSDEAGDASMEKPSNDLGIQTITGIFAEQVRRHPHKTAVVSEQGAVDYLSLDAQCSRLASLLAASVLPGKTLVGLMVEPCAHQVAAVLGILKSGGVCLPLDPAIDSGRLLPVLSGSGVRALVISARCLQAHCDVLRCCGAWGAIICLDEDVKDVAQRSFAQRVYGASDLSSAYADGPNPATTAGDAAFAYFAPDEDSPQLVASHATALDQASRETQLLSRGEVCSTLQPGAPLSAENTWQIIAPLISGGAVVYCADPKDPRHLLTILQRHHVSVAELSPYIVSSLLERLRELESGEQRLEALRLLMISGEPASVSLVNEWLGTHPNVPIVHTLRAFGGGCRSVIRRPVSEERLFVPALDAHSKLKVKTRAGLPAPVGVPGEIWSACKLPSARLEGGNVTSPMAADAHEHWVKTGYWGKRITDGGVEWFGRSQDGETIGRLRERLQLQAALTAHPDVRFCVVAPAGDGASVGRLAAHAVGRRGASLQEAELRAFAASVMAAAPDFDLHQIESLPLLPDGRVDCGALRETAGSNGLARNPVDEALIGLWSEMLKAPSVSIHDDFFALGGHSVLAMQLTARIRRIFQAEISLRSVFEARSIAQISDCLLRMEKAPGHAARLASIWLRTRNMSPAEIQELLRKAQGPGHGGGASSTT